MNVRKLTWACLLLGLFGCPPTVPGGACGGETCSAQQHCDPDTLHCVDGPALAIQLTPPAGVVTSAQFTITGVITDDAPVTLAEWRLDDGPWATLPLTGGEFTLTVDSPSRDGAVVVGFRARDAANEATAEARVVVDRLGPTLQLVSPDAGTYVGTATVEVAVVAVDGSGTISELVIGGTTVAMPASGVASTVTLTIPTTDMSDVFDFEVSAADSFGHRTVETLRVLVDRRGPLVTFVTPAENEVVSTLINVDTQVEDVSGVRDVSFVFRGATFPGVAEPGGHWTARIPNMVQEEAARSLTAQATDEFGHVSMVQRGILVDSVPPTITIAAPTAGSLHRTTADFSVSTSADAVSVSVTVNGAITTLSPAATAWTGQVTLPAGDGIGVTATVTARDRAGNSASVDLQLIADSVGPTIQVVSPTAGRLVSTNMYVSAVSSDAVSAAAQIEGQMVSLQGGPTDWSGMIAIPQRDYSAATVTLSATDAAGNVTSVDVGVFVDTVAPVVTFTAPMSGQKFSTSSFGSSTAVTSAWTVTDADPQAATSTVNGAPSTASTVTVATSSTDDGRTYTTTVVARDRVGNVGSASVSYRVDRVAPTIATWTPAANARNVDPLRSAVTFSEPVFGPLSTSPALVLRFNPAPTGDAWDLNHTRYTLPLDAQQGTVVTVGLATGLVDDFGNPLAAVADKKFHLVTTIPSGTLLVSNVSTFAASSDKDGAITIAALQTPGNTLRITQATRGSFSNFSLGDVGTRVSVNSWNTFDPSTLLSVPQFGVSLFNAAAPAGSEYKHFEYSNGNLNTLPETAAGAVISRQRLPREVATGLTGKAIGSLYSRAPVNVSLPTPADMLVAQSDDSWAAVSLSGSTVRWSRYRCNRDVVPGPATYTCSGTAYGRVFSTAFTEVEAAMTPSGSCLAVHVHTAFGESAIFQPLDNCDGYLGVPLPAGCSSNMNLQFSNVYIDMKMAPFAAAGEDTILFAYSTQAGNPSEFRLAKMAQGTCSLGISWSTLVYAPNVREFVPIQYGNKPAFLYVNTSNELRIVIP